MKYKIYYIAIFLIGIFSTCKTEENLSSLNCYELNKGIANGGNSCIINSVSDLKKIKNPPSMLFVSLRSKEQLNIDTLYKFKNIRSLLIHYNENVDYSELRLSMFENLCSVEIQGIPKGLESNAFKNLFKDIDQLSHLKLNQYGYTNVALRKKLPKKIDLLEVIFGYDLGEQIRLETLSSDDFKNVEVKKLVFDGGSTIGNSFYTKHNNKLYPNKRPSITAKPEQYKRNVNVVIEQFSRFKNIDKLIIKNTYIDTLTPFIGNFENLKTLKFFNCAIREIPKEIGHLNTLETLTIFNEKEINPQYESHYKYPKIKFSDTIKGLKNLKNLYLFNIDLFNFPEIKDANGIENFIYVGNGKLKKFPNFLKQSKASLKSLIWNKTRLKRLPDYINDFKLKVLNLNDNQLTTINNILDATAYAMHFTYDINNIPFKDRLVVNETRQKPLRTIEKIADSIYYGFQNNLLYRNIVYGVHRKVLMHEAFFPESQKDKYKSYDKKTINDFYHYLNISKQYNLDIGRLGSYTNCIAFNEGDWNVNNTDFEDYTEVFESKPNYPFYYETSTNNRCKKKAQNRQGFISDENTNPFAYRNTTGLKFIDTERIAFLPERGRNNQETFNTIIKTKGLKNIVGKQMFIDSIPQCFYELNMDTIQVKYFEMKQPFLKDFKYPSSYFRTNLYGNVPQNIKYLYVGPNLKEYPKEISLPNLKTLVREYPEDIFLEKEKSCYEHNLFPSNYLKEGSLDAIYLISNSSDSKVCFNNQLPKISSKLVSIGYPSPLELSPLGIGKGELSIIGFPKFDKNSTIEEIKIKGKFVDLKINNSILNVKNLRRIKIENTAVDTDDNRHKKTSYTPSIIGLNNIFIIKDLEELTLVNFKINKLPKTIKEAKQLKKLIIKQDVSFAKYTNVTLVDFKSVMLNQLPKELLELENLEEIFLDINNTEMTLDVSILPKLKKVTIRGGASLSLKVKKKLEDKGVSVTILQNN